MAKVCRCVPKLSINFDKILSRTNGNFEEQNKVLEPSTIIYCNIISACYNYNCIINSQHNYHISNTDLLEECDKKENPDVTGAAANSRLNRAIKTFFFQCPAFDQSPPDRRYNDKFRQHFTPLLTCVKMCNCQYYLAATVIHIQSTRGHVFANIRALTIYRSWSGKEITN
jgi:hypothetical protein